MLLTAAALKLVGWNISPFAQYGWLHTPTVQSSAVLWEALLGLWLLTRIQPFLSWLTALITFSLFAVLSGFLAQTGQSSCGCFGAVETSPWVVLILDLAILACLLVARPSPSPWRTEVRAACWLLAGVAAYGLVLAAFGWKYGSTDTAIHVIRGDRVIVTPQVIDFGTGRPSDVLSKTILIQNVSDQEIRLLGGTNDCTCRFGELVLRIPPGESVEHTVLLRIPKDSTPGWHCRDAQLYTDSPTNPLVRFKLCRRTQE